MDASPSSSISSADKLQPDQVNYKSNDESVLRMDSGFESSSEDSVSLYEDCSDGHNDSCHDGHVDKNVNKKAISDNHKLLEPIESVINILQLFFDNRLDEAMDEVSKRSDTCVHHSQAKMHFRFFYAMLTLDPVSY